MSSEFYPASYGGVRMWIGRITTPNGRDVIVHRLSRGDSHPIDDRGLAPRIAQAELLFDDMSGETSSPRERFDQFRELVEGGGTYTFVHPLLGSYRARIGDFEHTLEELCITATCTIIPAEEIAAVSGVTFGTSAVAGEFNVEAAADTFNKEIEAVGLESDVGTRAVAAVEDWQEPDIPTRDVLVQVQALTNTINSFIEDNRLADFLSYWKAMRASVMLSDAVLRAARAATASVSRTFTVLIRQPVSLRKLVAQIYGAHEAEDRVQQVIGLNDIRTPGWIPAGTQLVMPQAPSVQQRTRAVPGMAGRGC